MKHQIVTLLFLLVISGLKAQTDSSNYSVISLKQAIAEHKVKTAITGSYNPRRYYRLSDGNGLHYGRCMDVVLESQSDTFVVLKLDAGFSLIPEDSSFQTMFVTKTIEFPLYPRQTIPFNIYAMCGEIHDAAPHYGVRYSLGEMADTGLLTTIKLIEREYVQSMIGQHMLWAVANQASKEDLVKYGADSASLSKVNVLLSENNIGCPLTQENRRSERKESQKPAYMKVSKLLFYAGITYTILVTAGFIFLAVYSYRKKVTVKLS